MATAYVFDFDETLVDYDNAPTSLFSKFKQLVQSGQAVWVLTARAPSNLDDVWVAMKDNNLTFKQDHVVAVSPSSGYETRKADMLKGLVKMGYSVEFWDDDSKVYKAVKSLEKVKAHKV